MPWVTERRLLAEIGWTKDQLRGKVQRGVMIKGTHWALIDGARMFNTEAIQEWLNTQALGQRLAVSNSGTPTGMENAAASSSRKRRQTPPSRMQLGTDAA